MLRLKFLKGILLIIFFQAYTAEISFSQSQNRVIDSLTQIITTAKEDTSHVNLLNSLSRNLWETGEYDRSIHYAKQSLALAEKIKFKIGLARAYDIIAINYRIQGNYPEALSNHLSALKILEAIGNKRGIAASYLNIGSVYLRQNNYPEALKSFYTSLSIYKQINDKVNIAMAYNNIGTAYEGQNNYAEALSNYSKALKTAKDNGQKQLIAYSLGNIGNIYREQNKYEKALSNYVAALDVIKELGDKQGIVTSYVNMGSLSVSLGEYNEARTYFNQALTLSKETGNKYQMQVSYLQLSVLDSVTGNLSDAYTYLKLSSNMKDSILNEQSNKQISQLKIQYETEKKDKEIALLNSENKVKTAQVEKQKIIQYVGFLFALLIIVIALLSLNNIRIKNKARQLARMNEVRQKLSRDLHDEIGSGLSRISLLSQVTMQHQGNRQKTSEMLHKLKSTSQDLSRQMSEMVWKVNPAYDTLGNTLGYIRQYAGELLEENNVEYEINFPEQSDDIKCSTEFRQNIFLITKEVLNNTVKYARANKAELTFKLNSANEFEYSISDNGCGFELSEVGTFSNGLKNIRQRSEEIGAQLTIESEKEKGTKISLYGNMKNTT